MSLLVTVRNAFLQGALWPAPILRESHVLCGAGSTMPLWSVYRGKTGRGAIRECAYDDE